MPIDLELQFAEVKNNLLKWRSRYTDTEYPFKVVQNMFYQLYSMESIWDTIAESFDKKAGTAADVNSAYETLDTVFAQAAMYFTEGSRLMEKMERREDVGGINYADSEVLIHGARDGDHGKLEEIEFTYLHYVLANKTILIWASLGRTGLNIKDAIGRVTGAIVNINTPLDYEAICQFFGQFSVAPYLHEHYEALPPPH